MQLLRITFEQATFFHESFLYKYFWSFYAFYYFQNIEKCTLDITQEKLNTFHICSPGEIAFKRKNSQIAFQNE